MTMQNNLVPLKDCPIGLFLKENTLCVKTEYGLDAYIVSSGEYFWGGAKTKEERANVLVLPIPDEIVETLETGVIANGVIVPPCKEHDLVYDLVLCDDKKYRIFDMRVGKVNPYGSMHNNDVWNVYLIGTYTYAYRSFYDFGKTVFLTKDQAEQKLKEMRGENG